MKNERFIEEINRNSGFSSVSGTDVEEEEGMTRFVEGGCRISEGVVS